MADQLLVSSPLPPTSINKPRHGGESFRAITRSYRVIHTTVGVDERVTLGAAPIADMVLALPAWVGTSPPHTQAAELHEQMSELAATI
jgi:hypothetical protein